MKTTLVFPPFYLPSLYNLPPLGLLNLATVLRKAGHEVSVVDLVFAIREKTLPLGVHIYRHATDMILREEANLVGFSTQCATLPAVIRITELLKSKKPNLRIILGGHDVSFVAERILSAHPWIDAVIRGEGEITLRELADAYAVGKTPEGIRGVTWHHEGKILRNRDRDLMSCLDDLPVPDYSFVPSLERYKNACGIPRSIAILEVGRGCPHRCVYCSESIMWRQRSRTFSVPRIIGEMHHLREDFGAECFLLAYDQFTADRRFVEEFCGAILEERLDDIPWYCISRLDSMDPPLLRLMREAGCESMCYGIDSGSKRTLAFIRKRIDETILYQRVRETTDAGMKPTLSFIIGFPEEEREDIDKTLILALKTGIQGNSNPLIQLPTVLPGTDLHRNYGSRLVRETDTYFSLGLEFTRSRRLKEDIRLIESDPLLFSGFYNLPCAGVPLKELTAIAAYFPLITNLYPKSFLILTQALHESVSILFSRFLARARLNVKANPEFPEEICRRLFPDFAEKLLREAAEGLWKHIPDMVRYENMMIDVGNFPVNEAASNAGPHPFEEGLPMRNGSAKILDFTWNVSGIVSDLKNGIILETYERESVVIAAVEKEGGIEVTEINDFGRDMVQLSDGSTRIEEIISVLYDRYGEGMNERNFELECRTAFARLEEMGLLHQ